jgi:hypothetical protein
VEALNVNQPTVEETANSLAFSMINCRFEVAQQEERRRQVTCVACRLLLGAGPAAVGLPFRL